MVTVKSSDSERDQESSGAETVEKVVVQLAWIVSSLRSKKGEKALLVKIRRTRRGCRMASLCFIGQQRGNSYN